MKSSQHLCRLKEKSSVQNIHRQIQQARPKTTGSSEESWYSWINKKACPFSLIAPLQWQTPYWQRVSCPAPAHYSDNICHNSICAQSHSGTCWLVDTWPVFPPTHTLSNSPLCQHGPYDFTSKPSYASMTQSVTFRLFQRRNGERKRYTPAFLLHKKWKTLQASAAPTLVTSHYTEIDTDFLFFSLFVLFLFFLWTVAVDPADIPNYCGMLREAQVPGNLTPTALPSAWRRFLCPVSG